MTTTCALDELLDPDEPDEPLDDAGRRRRPSEAAAPEPPDPPRPAGAADPPPELPAAGHLLADRQVHRRDHAGDRRGQVGLGQRPA